MSHEEPISDPVGSVRPRRLRRRVDSARLHLQLARDQTDEAKKMAASGNDRAVLVLARAESDAELAVGLAREAKVHTDAVKATQDLAALHGRATP